jgi:transcriptional regulator with XRE-family HTH domain
MISNKTADELVLLEIGSRVARVRLELSLTQAGLSAAAGVSKRTIERIESGQSTQLSSVIRVLRALGVLENMETLIPPAVPGPIEKLDTQGKSRQRASSSDHKRDGQQREWTWGDEK